ncbi:MAG TPA: lactate racemase domain-containing protein [Isosphaeraceae bacterium]|nr:lactate racemase domain-containing protein [Isosphaeraceae bacterium]
MRVAVEFGEERLEFEIPEERVSGVWHGPASVPDDQVKDLVRSILEQPRDFPPLRQAVVPGDHVAIPLSPDLPRMMPVLEAVREALAAGGVSDADMQVVSTAPAPDEWARSPLRDVQWRVHDPEEAAELAYLATTEHGRRVYLNRALTDADCVVPVGRLGYDSILGYRGPWSVIFPSSGDGECLRSLRAHATEALPDRAHPRRALAESADVGWLLGSHFQLGIVPGAGGGLCKAIAGKQETVREEGMQAVDELWSFQTAERAELVVVGIGQAGAPSGIDDLALGLTTATRLVRRGGKIVALSRSSGPFGPALQRLSCGDGERPGLRALRGTENQPDYPVARQVAHALATADVYLLSALDADLVADLGMIVLDRPEEARKVAAMCRSCVFVSSAELTRAQATDE